MNNNFLKITHPILDPVIYYFCNFYTQSDIDNFTNTCPWFSAEELSIIPGDRCIVKYTPDYVEKISPEYFKRTLQKNLEVYSSVYNEAERFF